VVHNGSSDNDGTPAAKGVKGSPASLDIIKGLLRDLPGPDPEGSNA
jgi:hypothetical protein